ncbi:transposase [Polycladomyces sp. WAk]|uniref:Transposase n=1 Tax=Polycladomyces zharkentensis TaxID=2807616 RepID=A0ABS2WJV4_9BACL|nr:transposase [Polycladomyces sp. WAk]
MHRCSCGYEADRDVNAARNVLHRAMGYVPEPGYGQREQNLFQAWTKPSWTDVGCHAR